MKLTPIEDNLRVLANDNADLRAEVSRLTAELAARGQWEPVPDGEYHGEWGRFIVDCLSTSIWQVGVTDGWVVLPDGWELRRPLRDRLPSSSADA